MNISTDSLEKMWDEITPKLLGYLINTLRDRQVAEDVFQRTWEKALEALPRYQDRGIPFSAWLFTIARNECGQYWRKQNHEIPFDPALHDIPDKASDTSGKMILVEQILQKLPHDDREILRLRYIADFSILNIARILNTTSIAARVRIHRALKRAAKLAQIQ